MSTIKLKVGPTNMEREFIVEAEPASPVAEGRLKFTMERETEQGFMGIGKVSVSMTADEVDQLIGVLEAGLRSARRKR